jgi:hypothetical protein
VASRAGLGPRGEKEREKRRSNKIKRTFEFELKFELKLNPDKLQSIKQCKEHECT